jgi:hypothetical protein
MAAVEEKPLSGDDDGIDVSNTTGAWTLRAGLPPPNLATIKDFLRFIIATSRGLIDDNDGQKKVTVDSMNNFAEWLFAGFARVTGSRIDEEDRRAVYDVSILKWKIMSLRLNMTPKWTRNTLTKDGLVVNKKKRKHLFGETELVQFTNTF